MSLGDIISSLFGAGGPSAPNTPPPASMPSATPDDPSAAIAQLMKEEQASRPYDLLLKLGLGLMSSKNPSFAGALGEAGASALQGQEDAGTKALKRYMLQQQVGETAQKVGDRQTLRRALAGDKSLSDTQRTLILQNPEAAKEYLKRSMGGGLRLMDGTLIGGGPMGGGAADTAPAMPATGGTTTVPRSAGGDFASSLAMAENSGKVGGFNKQGYGGKYQFGEAALENAGVYAPGSDPKENAWLGQFNIPGMPDVKTAKDFFGNEAAQDAVFNIYRSGLEKEIASRGLDQFIGQTVGGVPITKDGILAMMHLGGPTGAAKFLSTGGQYNPADSNGTKLSDYAGRFARTQVADAGTTATDASPAAPAGVTPMQRTVGQGVRAGSRLQPVQDANGNIVSGWGYNPQTRQVEPLDEGKETSDEKNYAAARRGGYQGSFNDWMLEMKKAGRAETNIDMKQEGQEAKSEGERLVSEYKAIQERGQAAQDAINSISAARSIPEVGQDGRPLPSVFQQKVGNAAVALGFDPNNPTVKSLVGRVTDGQTFTGVMQNLVLTKMQAQKGPQTENDAKRIESTVASLGNTPEARDFLLRAAQAAAQRDVDQQAFYEDWKAEKKTYSGASKAWREMATKTPMVGVQPSTGKTVFFNEFRQAYRRQYPDASMDQMLNDWNSTYAKR